ncbi:Ankyrin repeat domain-containing protein 50 [Pseudocercospora fuligena]|uniref:Ankyrin repeat domain-containing protein 50 n=1 Tax=Pseudocercospora fuligena TaxID=685502 RepID=A0A8H6VEL3_9PEZI|nr:Ankyrin repeat domain-containing protein 50 [Pseudocercospora fuligena]
MAQASNISQDSLVNEFPALDLAEKSPNWIYYRNLLEIYGTRRYSDFETRSFIFTREGYAHLLKLTISKHSPSDEPSERYKTLLGAAVLSKSPETVKTMLEHHCGEAVLNDLFPLAVKDSTPEVVGVIAQHISSSAFNHKMMQQLTDQILSRGKERHLAFLIETGMDVDSCDLADRTLLRRALEYDHVKTVRVLLDHGASLEQNHNAICHILCSRKEEFARHMTAAWASSMQDFSDSHALLGDLLHAASLCGNLDVVQRLLAMGIPVDIPSSTNADNTALGAASFHGHLGIAQALLDQGADINFSKGDGRPICYAASQGHLQMVQFLLDSGANIHVVGVGETLELGNALFHACKNGHIAVVMTLLDRGLEANAICTSEWQETPLNTACLHGHVDVVKMLLERGADPQTRGPLGTAEDATIKGRSHTTMDESIHYEFNHILQLLREKTEQ